MVQIRQNDAYFSPSDLKTRSDCEFRFARVVDAKLGKGNVVPEETNAMLVYSGAVGQIHELYLVRLLREKYGVASAIGQRGVYEVAAVDYSNPDRLAALSQAVAETQAVRSCYSRLDKPNWPWPSSTSKQLPRRRWVKKPELELAHT